MTKDDFLQALRSTPRDWWLSGKRIRRGDEAGISCLCPITAVHLDVCKPKRSYWLSGHPAAASELGIDVLLGWSIAEAADGDRPHDVALRQELLEAVGLDAIRDL